MTGEKLTFRPSAGSIQMSRFSALNSGNRSTVLLFFFLVFKLRKFPGGGQAA